MQMSPLREPKINNVTTGRASGPDRSSTDGIPDGFPDESHGRAGHPSCAADPIRAGCIE